MSDTAEIQSAKAAAVHRIAVLDSFRALAIVPVLLFHYTMRWVPPQGPLAQTQFLPLDGPFSLGWLGVEFFFMISGFVIFMTLHTCGSLREFAARRFVRLYPTLAVAALITLLLTPVIGMRMAPIGARDLGGSLILAPTLVHGLWVDQAYWSLQIEAIFYAWIGLLFFAARERFVTTWLLLLAGSTLVSLAIPTSHLLLLVASPYLPFFSFGMAAYMRFSEGRISRRTGLLLAASAASYVILWHERDPGVHIGIGVMVLLFEGLLRGWLKWLAHPVVVWVGRISYPLYLLHDVLGQSILTRLYAAGSLSQPLAVALVALLMLALAAGVHSLVEAPVQKRARSIIRRLAPV